MACHSRIFLPQRLNSRRFLCLQDSYRLEGLTRVAYDADTGRYYFRGLDGSLWEGPEGAEFGQLRRGAFIPALHA